jgi:hypothetical protein
VTLHDPVNAVYDCGAELVEAASALRRAAADPRAAPAATAVLACIDVALRDIEATAELLHAEEPRSPGRGIRRRGPARRVGGEPERLRRP